MIDLSLPIAFFMATSGASLVAMTSGRKGAYKVQPRTPKFTRAPVPDAPVPDAPVPDAPVPDAPVPDAPVPDAPVPDAPADCARLKMSVKTGDINIRYSPKLSAPVVGQYVNGAVVASLGKVEGGLANGSTVWYRVKGGYVAGSVTKCTAEPLTANPYPPKGGVDVGGEDANAAEIPVCDMSLMSPAVLTQVIEEARPFATQRSKLPFASAQAMPDNIAVGEFSYYVTGCVLEALVRQGVDPDKFARGGYFSPGCIFPDTPIGELNPLAALFDAWALGGGA
jgi:hypothetical protein